MMTFYTTLKLLDRYNIDPSTTIITVSRNASRMIGTSACLREGDQLPLE